MGVSLFSLIFGPPSCQGTVTGTTNVNHLWNNLNTLVFETKPISHFEGWRILTSPITLIVQSKKTCSYVITLMLMDKGSILKGVPLSIDNILLEYAYKLGGTHILRSICQSCDFSSSSSKVNVLAKWLVDKGSRGGIVGCFAFTESMHWFPLRTH